MRGCSSMAESLDHSSLCGTESSAFFRSIKQLYIQFPLVEYHGFRLECAAQIWRQKHAVLFENQTVLQEAVLLRLPIC